MILSDKTIINEPLKFLSTIYKIEGRPPSNAYPDGIPDTYGFIVNSHRIPASEDLEKIEALRKEIEEKVPAYVIPMTQTQQNLRTPSDFLQEPPIELET